MATLIRLDYIEKAIWLAITPPTAWNDIKPQGLRAKFSPKIRTSLKLDGSVEYQIRFLRLIKD